MSERFKGFVYHARCYTSALLYLCFALPLMFVCFRDPSHIFSRHNSQILDYVLDSNKGVY